MAFTFTNYPILTPEQQNPMNALISRAMDTFGKGLNLSYLPQQREAEIFSKNIGPLANIAISPLAQYMAPEQRNEILKYISQGLGKLGGHANNYGKNSTTENYSNENATNEEQNQGIHLPPSGATETRSKEQIAGENIINDRFETLIDVVKKIQSDKSLGGLFKRATIGLAGAEAPLIRILANKDVKNAQLNLEAALMKYQHYTSEQAHSKVTKALTQTISDYLEGLKKEKNVSQKEIGQGKEILSHGIPIGREGERTSTKKQNIIPAKNINEAPPGSIGLYRDGELYFVPQNEADEALNNGFTYE